MSSIINHIIQKIPLFNLGCIKSPLHDVEKDLLARLNKSFGEDWIKKEYELINWTQVENILNSPESESITFLLWTPKLKENEFTIFVNNFSDGWINLLNGYSHYNNKEIIRATFSDENDKYPVFRFTYLNGPIERRIQLLREINKWEFITEGEPLVIEDVSNYKKKKLTNRLTNEIIEDYMKKLECDCTKKEFWLSEGKAIEYKFMLDV